MRALIAAVAAVVVVSGCASRVPSGRPSASDTTIVTYEYRSSAPSAPPSPSSTAPATGVAAFAWADHAFDAVTITLVQGVTPGQAVDACLGKLGQRFPSVDAALHSKYGFGEIVTARTVDGWTLLIEDNGFAASFAPALKILTAHGRSAGVFESINADMQFTYAVQGKIVRAFDPLIFYDDERKNPLPQEHGLHFGGAHPMAKSLELMRRLTGVALTRDDVTRDGWDAIGAAPI